MRRSNDSLMRVRSLSPRPAGHACAQPAPTRRAEASAVHALDVFTRARIDLAALAELDEQRHGHRVAGLDRGVLGDVRRRIALDPRLTLDDLHDHVARQADAHRTLVVEQDVALEVVEEEVLVVTDDA